MRYLNRQLVLAIVALALAALACGPLNFGAADEARETAEAAAERASQLAGTAVALATREGANALATVQSGSAPDLSGVEEGLDQVVPRGDFTVTVRDDQINRLIRLNQLPEGVRIPSQFQDVSLRFTDGAVVLRARVLQPLNARLVVSLRPTVVDGQARFEVVEASLAGAEVPQALLNLVQSTVSDLVTKGLANLPADVTLRTISVGEGTLTISGSRG
ncbi:MAG: LmeA family phospholipid-binding protein [Candidatus Promineifilaceae bacterium]|nr:LmeA family phospholipid-binding protein [Candidatus Promineifilaceae bacterium]